MEKKPTIGFVSAPAYFDPAPSEFAALVEAVGVSAMYPKQRVRLPKFIKISITYLNYNEISHNGKLHDKNLVWHTTTTYWVFS